MKGVYEVFLAKAGVDRPAIRKQAFDRADAERNVAFMKNGLRLYPTAADKLQLVTKQ